METLIITGCSELSYDAVYLVRFNCYQNGSERKRKGKSENVILADGIQFVGSIVFEWIMQSSLLDILRKKHKEK